MLRLIIVFVGLVLLSCKSVSSNQLLDIEYYKKGVLARKKDSISLLFMTHFNNETAFIFLNGEKMKKVVLTTDDSVSACDEDVLLKINSSINNVVKIDFGNGKTCTFVVNPKVEYYHIYFFEETGFGINATNVELDLE